MTTVSQELTIHLPRPHERQRDFIESSAKRKIIRAGRRGGKTVGMAILSVQAFLAGKRVLYATPTADQMQRYWFEVTNALQEPISANIFKKNETEHSIVLPSTEQRIRGKTAWNADTLRGDYADLLILDEWQLMNEDAWGLVGAPMLIDNNGDAVFIYTPPSARTAGTSKAQDKMHAAKLFKAAKKDMTGRWAAFHFTSHDNPYLSRIALDEITQDMTAQAIRQEIDAEDLDEVPGALWNRQMIEDTRRDRFPDLVRIVVAMDPAVSDKQTSDETGIIVAGVSDEHGYVLNDVSVAGGVDERCRTAINAYYRYEADRIVVEDNNGGDWIPAAIRNIDKNVPVSSVRATRNKYTRAEPVAALYEKQRIHHVGTFDTLEEELVTWIPGNDSPDHLDAMVWAMTELMLGEGSQASMRQAAVKGRGGGSVIRRATRARA